MARYANGRIPSSELVWFWAPNETGRLERFRATPATRDRILAAIADAKRTYGFHLYVTSGPNVYRDIDRQWDMRREHGLGAAWPGTSSHGGVWEGRDTMAVDFGNAQSFIDQYGRAEFNRLMKRHGLTPFLITRARGYAREEPWHCIDLNPWSAPKPISTSSKPATAEEEDEDMAKNVMHHTTDDKYKYRIGVTNPGSGFALVYVTSDPDINNELAKQYDTGSSVKVSRSLFDAIIRSTAAVAPQGELEVKVVEV